MRFVCIGSSKPFGTCFSVMYVWASSADANESLEYHCTDAKDLVRTVKGFVNANPSYADQIQPEISIRVQGRGNHPQPSGLEYRNEDQSVVFETDENGFLMNIERMVEVPSQGELCLLVDGALIPKQKDKVASMSLQFNFPFLPREAGDYPVSILREGMQDGGRIMKSVAPRGLGFMVPTLKTLIIRPMEKGGALPKVVLLKQDKPLSKHQPVVIGRSIYITTSTLKKSKADLLKIDGPYEMSASFKVDLNELAKLEKERAASNAQ